MTSMQIADAPIPEIPGNAQAKKNCQVQSFVDYVTEHVTLSIEEVADWHFTDMSLDSDWETPLVSVLRFFVEDSLPNSGTKGVIDVRPPKQSAVAV